MLQNSWLRLAIEEGDRAHDVVRRKEYCLDWGSFYCCHNSYSQHLPVCVYWYTLFIVWPWGLGTRAILTVGQLNSDHFGPAVFYSWAQNTKVIWEFSLSSPWLQGSKDLAMAWIFFVFLLYKLQLWLLGFWCKFCWQIFCGSWCLVASGIHVLWTLSNYLSLAADFSWWPWWLFLATYCHIPVILLHFFPVFFRISFCKRIFPFKFSNQSVHVEIRLHLC